MNLGTFTRNWRWLPAPPPPPAPEPLRLRPTPEPLHGNYRGACFSVWETYCHVYGGDAGDARMRRVLARILNRPVKSRRSLGNAEWKYVTRELEQITRRRDGGLHEQLFGHSPAIQTNRTRLLPAIYAALLELVEPCEGLAGSGPDSWLMLLDQLHAHQQTGCPGGDDCSLLAEAKRLLAEATGRPVVEMRRAA